MNIKRMSNNGHKKPMFILSLKENDLTEENYEDKLLGKLFEHNTIKYKCVGMCKYVIHGRIAIIGKYD